MTSLNRLLPSGMSISLSAWQNSHDENVKGTSEHDLPLLIQKVYLDVSEWDRSAEKVLRYLLSELDFLNLVTTTPETVVSWACQLTNLTHLEIQVGEDQCDQTQQLLKEVFSKFPDKEALVELTTKTQNLNSQI